MGESPQLQSSATVGAHSWSESTSPERDVIGMRDPGFRVLSGVAPRAVVVAVLPSSIARRAPHWMDDPELWMPEAEE